MNELLIIADWQDRIGYFVTNPGIMISDFAELLSFVFGLIYWNKFKQTPIRWFILFLGYNFFNEMAALAYYVSGLSNNNTIFYNVHQVIYFSVHFYIFYKYLIRKRLKLAVVLFYSIWLISFTYQLFTKNLVLEYALFSTVLGDFLTMISVLFVFIEVINASNISKLQDNMVIYIGLGLLVYLVISIPTSVTSFVGWEKIGKDTGPRMEFYQILRNVGTFAGALMYFIFAYGFYRAKAPSMSLTR